MLLQIFGFGSSSIEVCQNKWYAHYFKGVAGTAGYIGFVSGLDIGLGRVWNVAGKVRSVARLCLLSRAMLIDAASLPSRPPPSPSLRAPATGHGRSG